MHVNVGTGCDISIADFAGLVRATVGFEGRIAFDTGRPDGTPRKVMDVSVLKALGWTAPTTLAAGLKRYYEWFLANAAAIRE
jgi:nucleoside-diphosphate-sugar epimerase